jgi:hypothetical protein
VVADGTGDGQAILQSTGSFMYNTYHIFGLNITSVIALPARPVFFSSPDTPDIVIAYGNTPATLTNSQFKGVRFQAAPGEFLLRVDKVARYHVQNGSRITITPDNGASDDDILIFLMGSVMGALLHQRNILALHAGAIVVNGKSVIFAGPSGIGKSTLAAGFQRRGYPLLADDLCAITTYDGCIAVLPGFPRLKLWADALKKLDTDRNKLKSVRWGGNPEKYFLPVENIHDFSVPVHSVFILETTNTDRLEIISLKGGEKIAPLIDNTYRLRFLKGLGGKTDHFRQCAAVAAKAAVYRTIRSDKGFLLDELLDMVESRFLS